jgi:hypothetical protein
VESAPGNQEIAEERTQAQKASSLCKIKTFDLILWKINKSKIIRKISEYPCSEFSGSLTQGIVPIGLILNRPFKIV